MGVSLHSKIHPLFVKYSNGTSTQFHAYQYPSLFPVLFLQSLYVLFEFFQIIINIVKLVMKKESLMRRGVDMDTQH